MTSIYLKKSYYYMVSYVLYSISYFSSYIILSGAPLYIGSLYQSVVCTRGKLSSLSFLYFIFHILNRLDKVNCYTFSVEALSSRSLFVRN